MTWGNGNDYGGDPLDDADAEYVRLEQEQAAFEAEWAEESASLREDLARELGRLVLAVSSLDSLLWHVFVDLSLVASGTPIPSFTERDTSWRSQDKVTSRLAAVLGSKRVGLQQLKQRRDVMVSVLRKCGYPEQGVVRWEEWFDSYAEVNDVRNRCIHDPWMDEVPAVGEWGRWLSYRPGGSGEEYDVEDVREAVKKVEALSKEWAPLALRLSFWMHKKAQAVRAARLSGGGNSR